MRVEIDVIRLSAQLFGPILQFTFRGDGDQGRVAVATLISQMFRPVEFPRERAFALLTPIPRFAVVAQMFLLAMFRQRASVDEDFVTR